MSQVNMSALGTTQATGTPLEPKYCVFTTVVLGGVAVLPFGGSDMEIVVLNRGLNPLIIYPSRGGQIETLGADQPAQVVVGGAARFCSPGSVLSVIDQWYVG